MSYSARKKMTNGRGADDKDEIDLTPMLDVVFIMLIFFVVTASFLKEEALPLYVPENSPETSTTDDNVSMLIVIDANDDIFVDGRRVDIRAIRSLISQFNGANGRSTSRSGQSGASVLVRAHELASTETYVAIADAAREASISNYALVTYASR